LSQSQIIIHRYRDFLLGPKVTLCRLDGRVTQQEFDLLQISAAFPAKFRASSAQVVSAEVLDPNLLDDCSAIDQTA
jgi:hypothetical protein